MIKLLPHNESSYENVRKNMKQHNQVIYTSGVGTGKSFIAFKLIDEEYKNKKVLYIVPQESIANNIKLYKEYKKVKDSITFINWQQFSSIDKSLEIISKYDLIINDEVHHLHSDIYGSNILYAVNKLNKAFLGLTATPVRSDNKDIRNDIASVVNGISNFEAIKQGLMKPFTYIIGTRDKDLKTFREHLKQDGLDKKDMSDTVVSTIKDFKNCMDVVADIQNKYKRHTYIVFFNDIASLKRNKTYLEKTFSDKTVIELHSKINKASREKIIKSFNENKNIILLTVDMALEGNHFNDVDGIILFRNVGSLVTFEQMLGRVCAIGNKVSPIIIDCCRRGIFLLDKLIKLNNEINDYTPVNTKASLFDLESVDDDDNYIAVPKAKRLTYIFKIALGTTTEWTDTNEFVFNWHKCIGKSNKSARESKIEEAYVIYNNTINEYNEDISNEEQEQLISSIAGYTKVTIKELKKRIEKACA